MHTTHTNKYSYTILRILIYTGNITWARHLLSRIETPMKEFELNQNILASKDSKKIIKLYNKIAKTLVAFEYLWYQAWINSIEQAKAGMCIYVCMS